MSGESPDELSGDDALTRSQELLQLALSAAELGLWEWDLATGRRTCSDRVLAITGLDARQVRDDPETMQRIVHPEDVEAIWACDEAARLGRSYQGEYRIVRPDGQLRWVASHARTERDGAGVPLRMVGTLADISERKRAEETLREAHGELEQRVLERTDALAVANTQLANEVAERRAIEAQVREVLGQLVIAEEEERRRLARELHDSMGQHVTALTLGLQAVVDDPALPAPLRSHLEQLRQAARRIDDDIDRLAYELRPAVLDDLGLDDALRELAGVWAEQTAIVVDVHTRGLRGRRFAPAVETTVYRVVQEALTNVRKHAGASCVSLIVEQREDVLRAIVEDDGSGFDVPVRLGAQGRRLGLRGMTERAAHMGGSLEIETEPGRGTTVYLTVPLRQEED